MPASNERDESGNKLKFLPITQISKARTSEGRTNYVLTLQEYLGQENTEKGRQYDFENNKHLIANHQFSFDSIYGPQDS